jgi:hypothetical protein
MAVSHPHPPAAASAMPTCHEGSSVADGEFPASNVHTQMRLTQLQEGFTAQHGGQEGVDLCERIADFRGPQVGSR